MSKHEYSEIRVPVNNDSLSIKRDNDKCILCGACKSTCKYKQGVAGNYDLTKTGDDAICIDCGQCTQVCPTKALDIIENYQQVEEEIKNGKVVIFQTSPSIRVSLGEEFGMEVGTVVEGKVVSALKKLGASYVFDTNFGADLTIMEEATELINRIQENKNLPMFTSCCPAWVKYVEIFYPQYIPNLSTCKSPILMQGSIIKSYFAEKTGIRKEDIVNVAITPCTAKKAEIKREELKDMDYIVTVKELSKWIKEKNIDFVSLEESPYDSILGEKSGAGIIFGNTGGVMEAALRTAYHFITGEDPDPTLLEYQPVRGLTGVKESEIEIAGNLYHIAVISGTGNAKKFLDTLENSNKHYDFIEVMACPGGCISGGGQPKKDPMMMDEIREKRINSLYELDKKSHIRNSYENSEIKTLYEEFLKTPNSKEAEELLHTTYQDQSYLLEREVTYN